MEARHDSKFGIKRRPRDEKRDIKETKRKEPQMYSRSDPEGKQECGGRMTPCKVQRDNVTTLLAHLFSPQTLLQASAAAGTQLATAKAHHSESHRKGSICPTLPLPLSRLDLSQNLTPEQDLGGSDAEGRGDLHKNIVEVDDTLRNAKDPAVQTNPHHHEVKKSTITKADRELTDLPCSSSSRIAGLAPKPDCPTDGIDQYSEGDAIFASRKYYEAKRRAPKERKELSEALQYTIANLEHVNTQLDDIGLKMAPGVEGFTRQDWATIDIFLVERETLSETKKELERRWTAVQERIDLAWDDWEDQALMAQSVLEEIMINAGVLEPAPTPSDYAVPSNLNENSDEAAHVEVPGDIPHTHDEPKQTEEDHKSIADSQQEDDISAKQPPVQKANDSPTHFRTTFQLRDWGLIKASDYFNDWYENYNREWANFKWNIHGNEDELQEQFAVKSIRETSCRAQALDAAEKAYLKAREEAYAAGIAETNSDGGLGEPDLGYDDAIEAGQIPIARCDKPKIDQWRQAAKEAIEDPNPDDIVWPKPEVGNYTEEIATPQNRYIHPPDPDHNNIAHVRSVVVLENAGDIISKALERKDGVNLPQDSGFQEA
ncbi:hypothetical protein P154DRAFT_564706 [Amniculicola lignicola CBS 123094]|uniref:Uncharacterized protein n=1 Tax=Amniculicola lignicola CBS 123094 TaxID=1392246 RepID=A0A6A5WEK3_9PLEO|nr:hypothetical protein P154DRAFT_564706 [Amniculicola lignicola CBS 123094]